MQHGWFIRGKRSKQFLGVQGSVLRAFALPADATMFPTAQAAQAFADSVVMAPDLEVVDMVIHDPLPPDADQPPVRTFAQVRQDALDEDAPREAQRRATWSLIQKAAVALVAAVFCGTLLCFGPAAASPRDNLFPSIFGASYRDHPRARHFQPRASHAHGVATHRSRSVGARLARVHFKPGGLVGHDASNANPVAVAARYLGTNPTGHASLWCADFANFVERQLGRVGTGSREALSFLRYGPHVANPAPGDIVVLGRHGGGHVGFLIKQTTNGPLIISGNHGHRVGIGVYPPGRVIAYVRPA